MPSFLFAKNTRGENQWHEKTRKTGQIAITTTFPSEKLVCELFDVKWHQNQTKKETTRHAAILLFFEQENISGENIVQTFSTKLEHDKNNIMRSATYL